MEEGVPPLPPRPPPSSTAIVPFGASSSTYVVQVPKDQIFRVPPPENAEIVEHHRNMLKNKKKTPACYTHLIKVLAVALVVVLVCLFAFLVSYLVVGPRDPTFSVEGIVALRKTGGKYEYDVTLKATNPSAKMVYYFDKGGSAGLSHEDEKLASGRSPAFQVNNRKSEDIELVLQGSKRVELPKVIEKSLKGSKDVVTLSISVELPVRSSVGGIRFSSKRMNAECDVKVRSLGKETRIVSQKCQAKFQ